MSGSSFRLFLEILHFLDVYLRYRFSHLKLSNESVEKLMLILPEMSSLQLLKYVR